ncbi:MAG: hypothetical protein V4675_08245 [Verrucomicrobiota bacterium]
MNSVQKIAKYSEESDDPYSHPAEFKIAPTSTGTPRITATVPSGEASLIQSLLNALDGPILLLYVLHTTRGECPVGRYQSGDLTREEANRFLDRFKGYFQADARFDLWLHFPNSQATIVWDRHNLLYLYGLIDQLQHRLISLGFQPGDPNANFVHTHYYRSEFDQDARELLSYFDWNFSELRPEDIQSA